MLDYFSNDCADCRYLARHASKGLFFIGPSESKASTTQKTTNAQAITGNAAAGSEQQTFGAQATGNTVNIQSLDPALIGQIGGYLSDVAGTAEVNNAAIANNALGFGAEAANNIAQLAQIGQQTTSAQSAQEAQTISTIAGQLAQLTANATPQTTAAQQELLTGSSPLGASAAGINWTELGVIGAILGALYLFGKRRNA